MKLSLHEYCEYLKRLSVKREEDSAQPKFQRVKTAIKKLKPKTFTGKKR